LDIKEEAERLSQIVSNLLDLSRLQQGRLRLDRQPVDLTEHLRRTVEAMQLRLPHHRLVLGLPDEALVAAVDIKRLDQVVRNLLENAVKYSPAGGAIAVRARALDDAVVIEVIDPGIGIPQQDLERIFESFFRVDNEHTRRIGGVGLGLAICREIVEAHGGRIWANSTYGAGSTFSFTVPVGEDLHG
jgi:two-component system sensor histidine kinase VicK